ncbi:VOC family protein [Pseudoalteromonas ruthenica]|uniref:Glyoxalase n=1 Tax=Pseudoalteromonas ruthenica TaxID=151081 RepID=A0A0F4PL75_9GAMM|nr:VOC family protein [Pseudoalteromonas ruthenica]KJY95753.1 glyoxalase [Pseudoalteromonas ruthenica]KJZ00360.1 glyoxalase [Pseudoalteromonas ruthenica]TMO90188.1 VOC family protein [Pseudoalteromonas ruthenica]TMO90826.1 VOC family protein [Pseudoalteromonas ruthenica]TMP01063.1 VOC family protein [Pseudoalteromonas ruthenica]
MIGYVTLGTNDLQKAAAFYDVLLGQLGAARFMENERLIAWSTGPVGAGLAIVKPYDERPASAGNGTMVALQASSPGLVDKVYQKAVALGAKEEGEPGERGDIPGFYAGYFRDLDGNKLNVFYMPSPA